MRRRSSPLPGIKSDVFTCDGCGQKFTRNIRVQAKSERKFCSQKCRWDSVHGIGGWTKKGIKKSVQCVRCGTVVARELRHLISGTERGRYCSRECHCLHLKEKTKIRSALCAGCGMSFEFNYKGGYVKKFCTVKCYRKRKGVNGEVRSWINTTPEEFFEELEKTAMFELKGITAKNFEKKLSIAISQGEEGLDRAVGLYLWARDHLKEIHKVDCNYKQEDTIVQIKRVFNIDPEVYIRTAARIGGGTEPEKVEKGRSIIKRFGTYETFRADQLLGPEQMRKIIDKLPNGAGPDQFRKAVDTLRQKELGALQSKEPSKGDRLDYRKEYLKLVKKVAGLEARLDEKDNQIRELKKETTWLRRQVPKLKSRK